MTDGDLDRLQVMYSTRNYVGINHNCNFADSYRSMSLPHINNSLHPFSKINYTMSVCNNI